MSAATVRIMVLTLIAIGVPALGGCALGRGSLEQRLEDFDANVRIRAVIEVAKKDRQDLVPKLVDRLDDDDPAVRAYAILALEKMTGTRLGYSYSDRRSKRRQAIEDWRAYLKAQQTQGPEAQESAAPQPPEESAEQSPDGDATADPDAGR